MPTGHETPHLLGTDLARLLKGNAQTQDIPPILLSSMTDEGSRLLGLSSGATEYLCKPIERALLLETIRAVTLR